MGVKPVPAAKRYKLVTSRRLLSVKGPSGPLIATDAPDDEQTIYRYVVECVDSHQYMHK